ncbi:MAG: hypothetical protein NXI22_02690 [bacterium]|nr:hypothetical protein [bacterium]
MNAKCDEGYLCEVCGEEVESITDSDLYLRYVIGVVDPETLHTTPERHIRCHASLAQFIVADDFPPVTVEGAFAKKELDAEFVKTKEELTTRGWRRLQELKGGKLPITEYPLAEVRARFEN